MLVNLCRFENAGKTVDLLENKKLKRYLVISNPDSRSLEFRNLSDAKEYYDSIVATYL